MGAPELLTALTLFGAVLLITPVLGRYIFRVLDGQRTLLSPLLRPVETATYRVLGVDEHKEQGWRAYGVSLLLFSFLLIVLLYIQQRVQDILPLSQSGVAVGPVPPNLAFNTAVSFGTNTNWQNYSGESTMTYLTQMSGLAVRNFTSAAEGIVVAIALIRGLVRRSSATIGNFWVDLTRSVLYILLPISVVGALVLVSQGVVQTLGGSIVATTLQGVQQTLAIGPVASQEVIKELGNNGGGFFNANSAHPFESPNGLTNWFEMLLLLVIPFSLTYVFGRMAGNRRQGWALFAVMIIILGVGAAVAMGSEVRANPLLPAGIDSALGNMEGKDIRFGSAAGGLFSAVTTGTSTGAINAWHDSFLPIGGFIPLLLIQLGEVVPGGAGAGMYGILMFAIIAVFIAGLMVGRTPEFLGKKIEAFEMKMAMLVILVLAASILVFTGLGAALPIGVSSILNAGPHGFSEILYAFSSQTGNNGSAFGGLTGNTDFYNLTGAFAMLLGRFAMMVPILAIAGSMAAKRRVAPSLGTFPTTGGIWVGLLIGVILIVGALTFFPALALGPIVDELLMQAGKTF
jgi:K+-transporting ATPase ATPase A chain